MVVDRVTTGRSTDRREPVACEVTIPLLAEESRHFGDMAGYHGVD